MSKLRNQFFGRLAETRGANATAMGVTIVLAEEKEAAAPTELLRPGRHAPRGLPQDGDAHRRAWALALESLGADA